MILYIKIVTLLKPRFRTFLVSWEKMIDSKTARKAHRPIKLLPHRKYCLCIYKTKK